jgi:wobble nucleotide-excising tRNase
VDPKDDWKNAIETYHSLQEEVSNYNNILDRANRLIEAKKTEVETGDLSQSKNDLRLLRNQEKRHAPEIDELCREYAEFLEDKRDLEEQKQTAREALDQYADQIIEDYGDSINKHLCNCGAGFQIVDLSRNYRGGKPRTEYRLQIDNECINLGSQDTSIGEPSFKNTLSSGDKSALAFSLFVARLQQYPESELRNKIVVFDDPFSSLDAQRKGYTCRQIIWFAEKCAQVIVLTHNLPLARSVWDKSKWLNPQTLEIVRKAENYSDIERLEMLERTKSAYFQHYETLQKYLEEGLGDGQSLLSIATSIRPLLEGYLRMRFPQELKVNEWLGDFVGKLRDAEEGSPLYDIRSEILNELTDINDYSKKYHHDQNRNAAEEPITDTELCTYVDRTLRLIR